MEAKMSSSYARIDTPRRSTLFWAPVFIFAAVAGGVGIFEYGQVTEERERSGADHVMLAVTAVRDPADALQVAERQLVSGTIEFGVYRDLLQAALSRSDYQLDNAAYGSIQRVLANGRSSGERLKKWLPSLPTEVFITTSDKDAAHDIEQKLKRPGTDVVIAAAGKPFGKTQVSCYDQDVCKQTAPAVVNLLHEQGYDVDPVKVSDGSAGLGNRIDIQLAELTVSKPSKPASKPVIAKAAHHPKEKRPRLVAQE
jgi:hypothetical protein